MISPKNSHHTDGSWRNAGLALSIPMLMAAGPLTGFLLGWLIQRWTGWGDWIIHGMILVGLAAGIRETIGVIRKLK